jgi:hypothetical protein
MHAREIAKLAQIKLEDICAFAIARQVVLGQGPRKKLTAWPIKFRRGWHFILISTKGIYSAFCDGASTPVGRSEDLQKRR